MHRRFVSTLSALACLYGVATASGQVPYGPTQFAADREPVPAKPAPVVKARADIMPVASPAEMLAMPQYNPAAPHQMTGQVPYAPYAPAWEPGPSYDHDAGKGLKIIAGAGAYYVQPHFENNPAFTIGFTDRITDLAGTFLSINTVVGARQQDFAWDYEVAPRAWVGLIGCDGFGFRARWFWFDHGAQTEELTNDGSALITAADPLGVNTAVGQAFNASFPAGIFSNVNSPGFLIQRLAQLGIRDDPDVLRFDSDLSLEVYDLEAIQEISNCRWTVLFSGGARYAHMAQSYDATRFNLFTRTLGVNTEIATDFAAIRSGHNFDGVGPTGAIEVRRLLGDSGLALYGNVRGAVLFGSGKHNASAVSQVTDALFDPAGTPLIQVEVGGFASAARARDDVMPVVEWEVGAEIGRKAGNGRLILGAGLVGQTWYGAGNASSENGNLGLFGVVVNAGLSY